MTKPAPTDHPIHALIEARWSPRAFADAALAPETVSRLFEAARWSPSASNTQPWAFVIDHKGSDTFERTTGFLVPANAAWAGKAPLLGIAFAQIKREDGSPLSHALYDLGQAMALLSVQATHEGLYVHQMAGFSADDVRATLSIPDTWQPVCMFVIGHLGDVSALPDPLAERERAPRVRKPLDAFVFEQTWNAKG